MIAGMGIAVLDAGATKAVFGAARTEYLSAEIPAG